MNIFRRKYVKIIKNRRKNRDEKTRRLFVVFLCVTLLGNVFLSLGVFAAQGIEQVFSDGFELSYEGWEKFGSTASGGLQLSSTFYNIDGSGTKALKMSNHVNSWDCPAYNIRNKLTDSSGKLRPGTYAVQLWFCVEGITESTTPARLLLRCRGANGYSFMENHSGNYYYSIGNHTTVTEGQGCMLTGSFMITEADKNCTNDLLLCIDSVTGQVGSNIYIDDVKIYRLSDFSISNGDFVEGIAGWRSWGGNGYIYSNFDSTYSDVGHYTMVDQYSSIACNVNQILSYYGTGTYFIDLDVKLSTFDDSASKPFKIYFTKNNDQYHYNLLQTSRNINNTWQHIRLSVNTNTVPANQTQTLYQLLDPINSQVHLRFQREANTAAYSYEIANVKIEFANEFSYGTNQYDFGNRYVSTYHKHQVNGFEIEMKVANAYNNQYPIGANAREDIFSKIYESGGDVGAVSSGEGDHGGISYGLYQFTQNDSAPDFIEWMAESSTYRNLYNSYFAGYTGNYADSNFANRWKNCAKNQEAAFAEAQYQYAKKIFYDDVVVGVNQLFDSKGKNKTFDINSRSKAVKNLVFSVGAQNGTSGAAEVIAQALWHKHLPSLTETDYIEIITERLTRTYVRGQIVIDVINPPEKPDDIPPDPLDPKYVIHAAGLNTTKQNFVEKLNLEDRFVAKQSNNSGDVQVGVLMRHYGIYFDALKMYAQEAGLE